MNGQNDGKRLINETVIKCLGHKRKEIRALAEKYENVSGINGVARFRQR